MSGSRVRFVAPVFLALGSLGAVGAENPFPEPQPSSRAEALEILGAVEPAARARRSARALDATPAERHALGLLEATPELPASRTWRSPGGTTIHYTLSEASPDRVGDLDANGNDVPDAVEEAGLGADRARQLWAGRLALPEPADLELVLANLAGAADGYVTRDRRAGHWTIVLDAPARGASPATTHARIRRAAARQYATAAAFSLGPDFPAAWAGAFGDWAAWSTESTLDARTAAEVSRRLARLPEGLFPAGSDRGPAHGGLLAWLAFLEEAYGTATLRVALGALAEGSPGPDAFDRALRRGAGVDLAAAFREYHLWTLLVGGRADRLHLPFAAALTEPPFASDNGGLPALSVQADPPVRPWGATQVRFDPGEGAPFDPEGGLRLTFEGAFGTRWEADLVVADDEGTLHRVALGLADGRGEISVPLQGVAEAWLLVRNLGSIDGLEASSSLGRPYSYTADREPDYPFELGAIDAVEQADGVVVSWETLSELDVVGYNVLRLREAGGNEQVVNPVWIPALGDPDLATTYVFVDQSANPAARYVYRVEAITGRGFTSRSEAVSPRPELSLDP